MAEQISRVIAEGLIHDTEKVFSDQLHWIVSLLTHHPEYKSILTNPELPAKEKQTMLEGVIKDRVDPQVYNVILMMVSTGRLHLLESVQEEFERMGTERTHHLTGSVESAYELDEDTMVKLENRFTSIYGRKVKLSQRIDSSLIGGLIVTIGDRVYDGSLRTRLDRMKNHILQE